ncbi:MAG TPA: PQQ-binding-like beta-propeller repeat protein, partial [Kofleriaceae bacterium]
MKLSLMKLNLMKRFALLALASIVSAGAAGCTPSAWKYADAMRAGPPDPLGEDRLSLRWKFSTADRLTEVEPQEFAAAAVYADTVYIGSASGWFFALRSGNGALRWRKRFGAVASAPIVVGGVMYIGCADGTLLAVDAQTGAEKWRYQSRGPIEQRPVPTGDLIVFSNEADQVVAVDAITGKFKWQYKAETPEEYTLRGHAGVTIDNDLIYSGFSNGTLVALRKDTGSVAWSTSLKGEADRFVDVDATPLVIGENVYASSS